MPANKYALLRYRIIDRCLNNPGHQYPDKEFLRRTCEEALYGSDGEHISESTIEKDLWAMRNESELGYYAPIKYSKEFKGYFYDEEGYSINELSLSGEDIEAIKFAATTLFQFRQVPIFKQYQHAIEKIIDRMNISPDIQDSALGRFVQFEQVDTSGGNKHLSSLLEAIKNKNSIILHYRKFNHAETNQYHVDPYLLKEYRNRWYLIAYVPDKSRTFGLDRIIKSESLNTHFEFNKEFDSDHFFKHSIGITRASAEPTEILLRFNASEGDYLKTLPLHSSQEIISETENEILLRLFVLETYELYSLLLSYGNRVEVLSPKKMRDHFRDILEKSLSSYSRP
jgi:predicted DNA-binding transcriptional regulator YafY